MTALLEIRALRGGYGAGDILTGIDLDLEAGEILVLAGPNGSGKSTLARAVMGLLSRCVGDIRLDGEAIGKIPAEERSRRGLALVPQTGNVFEGLTVLENLLVADAGREARERIAKLFERFPVLAERKRSRARVLSGGERQQLAFARALLNQPKLVVLDEPTANLAPALVADVFRQIVEMRTGGIGVLLVEQRARQALAIADRGAILAAGSVAATGTAASLLADPLLAERFLGMVS